MREDDVHQALVRRRSRRDDARRRVTTKMMISAWMHADERRRQVVVALGGVEADGQAGERERGDEHADRVQPAEQGDDDRREPVADAELAVDPAA